MWVSRAHVGQLRLGGPPPQQERRALRTILSDKVRRRVDAAAKLLRDGGGGGGAGGAAPEPVRRAEEQLARLQALLGATLRAMADAVGGPGRGRTPLGAALLPEFHRGGVQPAGAFFPASNFQPGCGPDPSGGIC